MVTAGYATLPLADVGARLDDSVAIPCFDS
jgi:hypothetical protein